MNGMIEHVMRVVDQQHRYYTGIGEEYWIEFQPEYSDAIKVMERVGMIETANQVTMGGKNYTAEDGSMWVKKLVRP